MDTPKDKRSSLGTYLGYKHTKDGKQVNTYRMPVNILDDIIFLFYKVRTTIYRNPRYPSNAAKMDRLIVSVIP